jgi:membrane protein implicated in regulation of membrane protease activity
MTTRGIFAALAIPSMTTKIIFATLAILFMIARAIFAAMAILFMIARAIFAAMAIPFMIATDTYVNITIASLSLMRNSLFSPLWDTDKAEERRCILGSCIKGVRKARI